MFGTDHRYFYILPTMLVPLLFFVAISDGGEGSTPPPEGDWNITTRTTIDGRELYVHGNITVSRGVSLTIRDSFIQVNTTHPQRFTMRVADGATLTIINSVLYLDIFESGPQASIVFSEGTVIRTMGTLHARSVSLFAEDVTFLNYGRYAYDGEPGRDAILVLDGSVNSEFRNITIRNEGGKAGRFGLAGDGNAGGRSILISNVSHWIGCTIECRAGNVSATGLNFFDNSPGNSAHGTDAEVHLQAAYMEDTLIKVYASDGGTGVKGYHPPGGDAGHGGDGSDGGNCSVLIEGPDDFLMVDCFIYALSGTGGSGGNGGETVDGTAGDGGEAGNGGDVTVQVTGSGDMSLKRSMLHAFAGGGGWGGDYGRLEEGGGSNGVPSEGGDGGHASIYVQGPSDLFVDDLTIEVRGGDGLDGGGGYEQGERGGDSGDGAIHVVVDGTIEADLVDLKAIGGNGGPGGPAFSDIQGNGGDGGDAIIVFTGLEEMDISHFSIYVIPGQGGRGAKPIYDGTDGVSTLDIETQLLYLSNGTLNMPLDDLSGDARGYLYNVTFDMEFGIHVLPIGDAIVWEKYPVTVLAIVNDGGPCEGSVVSVFHIETGALVDHAVVDEDCLCYFDLLAFEYTSLQVNYMGSYHFIISSPDRKTTKTVRGEIQGQTQIRIYYYWPPPMITIVVERPEQDVEYSLYPSQGDHLESQGYFSFDNTITAVFVQLVPVGEDANSWPKYKLGLSPVPYEDLADKDVRWGKYFPPGPDSNRWPFFYRFPMADDKAEYFSGTWEFHVIVSTGDKIHERIIGFDLMVDENLEIPWVQVNTDIHGKTFNGSTVVIEGTAGDDYQIMLVEVRVDSGEWVAVGTAEEWTHTLDTGALGDGSHTIDFRAFDGLDYSNINASSFEVRGEGDPPVNGGGNGDPEWTTQTYLIVGGVTLMVIALALVVAMVIVRVRSPPDSSGEG